jgi:hypothetical protein
MRRVAVFAAVGVAVAGLVGCDYKDGDFVTRCGGALSFRAIDADGAHEVVVTVPSTWIDEAVDASTDVVKTVRLPSDDLDVVFNVGHDLDEIETRPCLDLGQPPSPVVDLSLGATSGAAEIVLHPADYWREVRADLTLEGVAFSDGETTVSALSMDDVPVGNAP